MDRDDDLDDVLDGRKAEMEERFRELEHEEEIERLRQKSGAPPRAPRQQPDAAGHAQPAGEDPLADLKAAVDGAEVERYVLVECPHCQGKNRVPLSKLRRANPVCGRCKKDLSFIKS
jgi:hypothetical protein